MVNDRCDRLFLYSLHDALIAQSADRVQWTVLYRRVLYLSYAQCDGFSGLRAIHSGLAVS